MKAKLICAALGAALLLSACAGPEESREPSQSVTLPSLEAQAETLPTGAAPTLTEPGLPLPTEPEAEGETSPALPPAETQAPVVSQPSVQPTLTEPSPTEPPVQPTEALPAPVEGLEIVSVGLYDGLFPEDGSDRAVESVVALLVQNTGNRSIQYAELYYEIDGQEAVFKLSELPAGAQAMVLESKAMVAAPFSAFKSLTERNVSVFHDLEEHPELVCTRGENGMTVTNNGDRTYASVDVCYKLRYGDDATLLGGIAYHVRVADLAPGQSKTVQADHYFPESCEIVSITAKE